LVDGDRASQWNFFDFLARGGYVKYKTQEQREDQQAEKVPDNGRE
jgi:hypothetical protein